MRFLPVFLDLQAGQVLLIGSGELAQAKLRVLAAAGAQVRWYALSGDHDVNALEPAQAARIECAAGDPLTASLDGVVAVFCAGAGEAGVAMAARAKSLGLPANVMDDLQHSTFIFPAIVDRGDVVVAVGTGGTSPVVARRVRERIEAALPARIGELASFIGRFRKSIHDRIPEFPLRRRFWEKVIDGRIGTLVLSGRAGEAEAALNEIGDASAFAGALASGKAEGSVTLVGAGPGDPDLLTIKALRALQDADIVFHDEEIAPEVLDRIRRDAARVVVSIRNQNAISAEIIDAAKAGRRVVWLKAGEAFGPGHGGSDLAAFREAGLVHFVVPGVAAGFGDVRPFSPSAALPLRSRASAGKTSIK
jgi:uroporphyrin-III C-methyltransferase / precorrin-2 dehydrogenase / sirohydrochlorin ferrochelatase